MRTKKSKNKTSVLIISDIHLGSKVSRAEEVSALLRDYEFKKLILLGDIFENLNFDRLREEDWRFLNMLSKISKTAKIRWVEGNHDNGLARIFGALTGAKVYSNYYIWRYKKKKYLAIHGHQFDNFLIDNAFISFIASRIYNLIQLIDFKDKRISHYLKNQSKGWLRLSDKVAKRALLFARIRGVDFIFCGHTHKALEARNGKIHYFNSGCWTDVPSTYITIDAHKIRIHSFD